MEQLTIAIPTYNRLEELKHTLIKVLPQLVDEKLLIIDNHSPFDISKELENIISEKKDRITIYRNENNIGLSGNFLKAFELCETKYLWILGDDDDPLENAIEIIESTFLEKEYDFVKFASSIYKEEEESVFKNTDDFLNYFSKDTQNKFSNLLFVSNSIFNNDKIRSYIQYGYQYANTFAPHLAIFMHYFFLSKEKNILIHNKEIVEHVSPIENRWTRYKVYLGFKSFDYMEANLTKDQNNKLLKIVHSITSNYKRTFIELHQLGNLNKDYKYSKRVYRFLFFENKMSLKDKFLSSFLYLLISKPSIVGLLRKFVREFNKVYLEINLESSKERL